MPSARDLMQKADALMRSNRSLGGAGSEQDIPVLTDVVIAGDATVLRQQEAAPITGAGRPRPAEAVSGTPHPSEDELAKAAKEEARRESEKRELAETVYFEVLRSLDVDDRDAMRERLSRHLLPVFEQMGRDLIVKAEQALGAAIRDQVAAAIERKLGVPPPSSRSR